MSLGFGGIRNSTYKTHQNNRRKTKRLNQFLYPSKSFLRLLNHTMFETMDLFLYLRILYLKIEILYSRLNVIHRESLHLNQMDFLEERSIDA